jgi:GT2 family glycosyltransferase
MLALSGPPFHLLICDNASTDESHERLRAWILEALRPADESHQQLVEGAFVTSFGRLDQSSAGLVQSVHLMRLPHNFGYAGAINRCIAWGRQALDPCCYWLLNNDVSLDSQALAHLVAAVRSVADVGLCGSVLLEWEEPHRVQAIGGLVHRALAVGSHLREFPAGVNPEQELFYGADYPVGASLFATREFIRSVGLMDENYFLYYEEADWAERGRACGFRPAVAIRSLVRHKEGASTGSTSPVRGKSMLSEYYGVVNRLRFTRKFSPWLLPVVWLSLLLVVFDRSVHREWKRAGLILRLMLRPGSVARPHEARRST